MGTGGRAAISDRPLSNHWAKAVGLSSKRTEVNRTNRSYPFSPFLPHPDLTSSSLIVVVILVFDCGPPVLRVLSTFLLQLFFFNTNSNDEHHKDEDDDKIAY